jgi:hypothetical protein
VAWRVPQNIPHMADERFCAGSRADYALGIFEICRVLMYLSQWQGAENKKPSSGHNLFLQCIHKLPSYVRFPLNGGDYVAAGVSAI